jgi:predicted CoA-binding protein
MKKTLIIRASTNPERYSYKAAQKLIEHQHPIELIGRREEMLFDHQIHKLKVSFTDIDTISLYLSPKFQKEYYDYLIQLNPRRVIFNPGTENEEFEKLLTENNISYETACTLVLLATNSY